MKERYDALLVALSSGLGAGARTDACAGAGTDAGAGVDTKDDADDDAAAAAPTDQLRLSLEKLQKHHWGGEGTWMAFIACAALPRRLCPSLFLSAMSDVNSFLLLPAGAQLNQALNASAVGYISDDTAYNADIKLLPADGDDVVVALAPLTNLGEALEDVAAHLFKVRVEHAAVVLSPAFSLTLLPSCCRTADGAGALAVHTLGAVRPRQ